MSTETGEDHDIKILWVIALVQTVLRIGLRTLGVHLFGLLWIITDLIGGLLTASWALRLRCRWHAPIRAAAG